MAIQLEELYSHLAIEFDFHSPKRSEWRSVCYGSDRLPMQRLLLELARGAKIGTTLDRLAIYKAAHAVLPLVGSELVEFTRLLVTEHPVPLEWCDVLIDVLAESPARELLSGDALTALHNTFRQAETSPTNLLKIKLFQAQILSLGYTPSWLIQPPEGTNNDAIELS